MLADFTNSTGDPVFDGTLKTALEVALNQSHFLNVLSDNAIAATLQLMTRPANTRLTPQVTQELCRRAGSKAYIAGPIDKLGSEYAIGLKAVSCSKGVVPRRAWEITADPAAQGRTIMSLTEMQRTRVVADPIAPRDRPTGPWVAFC